MQRSRRLVGVAVSDTLMIDMMRDGWKIQFVENMTGVPEDAECVNVYNDLPAQETVFVFSHPSFEEVPFGVSLPLRKITFRKFSYPEVDALLEKKKSEDRFPMGELAG